MWFETEKQLLRRPVRLSIVSIRQRSNKNVRVSLQLVDIVTKSCY